MGGITGENLLKLLECRLDNVVYRLGIAPTRAAARQLVSHCHICVNGSVVNIPSYSLRAGDVVSVREKSKSLEVISAVPGRSSSKSRYAWLEWDNASMSGQFPPEARARGDPREHQGAAHRRVVLEVVI